MRVKLDICTCGSLRRAHIGGRSRCQGHGEQPCPEACQYYVKANSGSKYGNRRVGGADSKLEADRFAELAVLLKGGTIKELELHPRIEVQPPGCKPIWYRPDSRYCERQRDGSWVWVIEDTKGGKSTDGHGGRWPVVWKLCRAKFPEAILRVVMRDRGRWTIKDDPPRARAAWKSRTYQEPQRMRAAQTATHPRYWCAAQTAAGMACTRRAGWVHIATGEFMCGNHARRCPPADTRRITDTEAR